MGGGRKEMNIEATIGLSFQGWSERKRKIEWKQVSGAEFRLLRLKEQKEDGSYQRVWSLRFLVGNGKGNGRRWG